MNTLSPELRAMIVNEASWSDLLNLRLASRSLSVPATYRLFSYCHVTPQADSQSRYQSLLSSMLAQLVSCIKLTTSNGPYKDKDDYDGTEEKSDFTEEFEHCFRAMNRFPNLRDVSVEFSATCLVEDEENIWREAVIEETVFYRYEILRALFETLDDPVLPAWRLRSLTIKHLQNYNDERIIESSHFNQVLSRLSELRIKIITEYETSAPENSWRISQMHTFFADLPATWLKPTIQNLSSLCIHVDVYWGYFPLCNLRTLYFPQLKKLEL